MREIPILFNIEMVKAILEGRKTQTRRPVKVTPKGKSLIEPLPQDKELFICGQCGKIEKSPFGKPGDVLWVRETFARSVIWKGRYHYKADHPNWKPAEKILSNKCGWKPSIHMPKEACRLKLKVKRVWVERVQDISEKDCIKEGALRKDTALKWSESKDIKGMGPAKFAFSLLWQSIYGGESWERNDWVWCCEFEVMK